MKSLRYVFFAAVLFIFTSNASAQFISVGAGGVYGFDQENIGVNVNAIVHILPIVDIKGGFNYFFADEDQYDSFKFYTFDLDAHYVLLDIKLSRVYALAGLNIGINSFDLKQVENAFSSFLEDQELSTSNTEVGFNIGAGGEVGLGQTARLFGELKYITGNYSEMVATVGIRFGF